MARILHIEDDPRNLRLVRKLLGAVGHQVFEATNGLEAIALARDERPELILVDINVPDFDGYEIILRLRGIEGLAETPIVAITAEGDRETSLAVGANGFLEKPIDAKRFVHTIGRFLQGHRERGDHTEPRLREQSQRIVQRLEAKVRELSESNLRLEEMARVRREFLRNVTHELATPLTPIVGYLHLLSRGNLGPVSPAQEKALSAMSGSIRKLRHTVDTLLDVSALERGQMTFERERVRLQGLVEGVIAALSSSAEDARVHIEIERSAAPLWVEGDGEKLSRAISHVVENALKFSSEGGSVGVACRASAPGQLTILVADDGPGVPLSKRETAFEPFFQLDGSMTRSHGGAGLGLPFARRVAQAHGGDVRIEDAPSELIAGREFRGALVRITLADGA